MLSPASVSMPHFYCVVESPVESIWAAGPWFVVRGKPEQSRLKNCTGDERLMVLDLMHCPDIVLLSDIQGRDTGDVAPLSTASFTLSYPSGSVGHCVLNKEEVFPFPAAAPASLLQCQWGLCRTQLVGRAAQAEDSPQNTRRIIPTQLPLLPWQQMKTKRHILLPADKAACLPFGKALPAPVAPTGCRNAIAI